MSKKFWIAVLVISSLFLVVLCLPNIELYFGWNMPFIHIDIDTFTIYGYNVPKEKQLGIMILSGVLMMAPGRLIPLAINKLREING